MSDQSPLRYGAPDPTEVNKWGGQVRAWLAVITALGVAVPNISDAEIQAYVSAALVAAGLASAIWSWIEKKRQGRAAKDLVVDSAVASARSGVPVLVEVTEVTAAGQPNLGVATEIRPAAVATATIVPSPPGTTAADLNQAELRRNQ